MHTYHILCIKNFSLKIPWHSAISWSVFHLGRNDNWRLLGGPFKILYKFQMLFSDNTSREGNLYFDFKPSTSSALDLNTVTQPSPSCHAILVGVFRITPTQFRLNSQRFWKFGFTKWISRKPVNCTTDCLVFRCRSLRIFWRKRNTPCWCCVLSLGTEETSIKDCRGRSKWMQNFRGKKSEKLCSKLVLFAFFDFKEGFRVKFEWKDICRVTSHVIIFLSRPLRH